MEMWSIGYENLQMIYQQKALGEENTVERIIFSLMHCKSLAFKEKGIRCRIQLGNLGVIERIGDSKSLKWAPRCC
jgi:hypothetical protein